MPDIHKQLDIWSRLVILVTLVLFVAALFFKGFGHDLLLEAGVFLVSIKLIMMAYKNSVGTAEVVGRLHALPAAGAGARRTADVRQGHRPWRGQDGLNRVGRVAHSSTNTRSLVKNQSAWTLLTFNASTTAAPPSTASEPRISRLHVFQLNIDAADRIDELKFEVTGPTIAPSPWLCRRARARAAPIAARKPADGRANEHD